MKHNLSQAVKYGEHFEDDVTIISGELDEIKTHKYLLTLLSPSIRPLLSTPCCIAPTLLLPDCSTFSLQHLINIITTGYTVTEGMSSEEIIKITQAAQLLSVDMKDLQHGRSKMTVGINSEQQQESLFDNESLFSFDSDYNSDKKNEPRTGITNAKIDNRLGKRKRTQNGDGEFVCHNCEYQTTNSSHFRSHVESIHEGLRYPCSQCEYKATQKGDLKLHVESIHEGVRYPCSQCEYKATNKRNIKRHVKSLHTNNKN